MQNTIVPIIPEPTDEFITKAKNVQLELIQKMTEMSQRKTPRRSRDGQLIIKRRDDGYNYIIEAWMRGALDNYFPGWSWEMASPVQLMGVEVVIISGHLIIPEPNLLYLGIYPPIRKFYSVGANRIQFKSGKSHTAENLVDFDKSVAGANGNALKRGINRICRIGDDVYHKLLEFDSDRDWDSEDIIRDGGGNIAVLEEVLHKYNLSWKIVMKVDGFEELLLENKFSKALLILERKNLIP